MIVTERQKTSALNRANRRQSARLAFVWDWLRSVVIAMALFMVIRAFFVEAFKIPTGSMEGTLLVGDFLLVNKLVYGADLPLTGKKLPGIRQPRRGDVIVFQWPVDPSKNFVKRIVGMPGDTIAMRDGRLLLNGVAQTERYVVHSDPGDEPAEEEFAWQRAYLSPKSAAAAGLVMADSAVTADYHPSRNNWGPIVVPRSSYFVLGDNRDNSLDSRYWGFVADSLVRGQPIVVYYSYNPDSARRLDWLTRVRWKRFGELIQ